MPSDATPSGNAVKDFKVANFVSGEVSVLMTRNPQTVQFPAEKILHSVALRGRLHLALSTQGALRDPGL